LKKRECSPVITDRYCITMAIIFIRESYALL